MGKPGIGVHLNVEANALDGTDFFSPPETRWVSGAQRFDLPDITAGAMTSMDVPLTIETSFARKASVQEVQLQAAFVTPQNKLRIEFLDNIQAGEPIPIGFTLFTNTELVPFFDPNNPVVPGNGWMPVNPPPPVFSNPQNPRLRWFEIDAPTGGGDSFYSVTAILDNSPMVPGEQQ